MFRKPTISLKQILLLVTVAVHAAAVAQPSVPPLKLWFDSPARSTVTDSKSTWDSDPEWLRALPVGNGFMGAMIFGDVNHDRIQLNEKTLWSGSQDDNNNPEAAKWLPKIRQLLFDGNYLEANELTKKTQVCKGAGSGKGEGANVPYGSFQTLGDLVFDFGTEEPYSGYRKELDLRKGLVTVFYVQGNRHYKREIFASYPDRALIMHITSNEPHAISFSVKLTRQERCQFKTEKDNLMMFGWLDNGKGGEGMQYATRIKAIAKGGKTVYSENQLSVQQSDDVVLILTASTNYKQDYPSFTGENPVQVSYAQLNKAAKKSYASLLKSHLDDYTSIFSRVELNLSGQTTDTIPTDRRLINQKKSPDDLHLQELYFQFGRYLLIASSRKGSLPANLQGVWANKIQVPWNCDYHTNINVQMNYWPADVTNLSDCFSPFVKLVESLVKPGEKTASVQYHARGWCVEPITNVWGYTSPGEGTSWGMYVAAGGWLCGQLWDHYTFCRDNDYLKEIYPVLLKSAQFYLDWLVKDPVTGKLVSGPSTSPENSFIAPDGSTGSICMAPSHDQEIIAELFTHVVEASRLLKDTNLLVAKIDQAIPQLAQPAIASDGRLMEWSQAFKESDPTHRHVSHLYMWYPVTVIGPSETPELAEAARKSLEARTDVGTGWSLAWKISFWARLKDGNRAYKLLKELLYPTSNY
ncbi:MAG: glycoside hydrolase family 95 protein, partial [Bacteroidota bacterium]|nr:glycoside hydrolase family 95 protein [Bacteroidota bacterium]